MAATDRTPWDGWDTEVELRVRVRVEADADDDYFEGLLGRKPEHLAIAALMTGRDDPSRIDGFADMRGSVTIEDVEEAW